MAIAPVVIEFLAKGMPQVQQAFQSIHAAAVKAERAQQAEADKTTKAVKKATDERVKMQIAAMKKVDGWERQARTAGEREALRHEKVRIQSEERIAKGKIAAMKAADKLESAARKAGLKEAEQFARRQQAIRDQSAKMAGQFAARQAREEAAAAKRSEQDRYQAIRDRISRTKQAEKDLDAWQKSQQKKTEKSPVVRNGNPALGRVVESVTGATFRGVGAGLNRAGNIAMGLANTTAQLGGGFSIADSVMAEKNMRKQAAILSAKTILNGGTEFSTNDILSRAKAVGIAQAIDPSEVMAGYDEIQKLTGNSEMAFKAMPGVAKIATATGADLQDTSKLAANILSADPTMSAKDLDKQLRIFTRQGLVGGVEVNEFAKYGSRITGSASMYGGKVEDNEVTLGAMAQMARQYGTASGAPEAMMGSQRFGSDVMKHAKDLEGNGIKVRDGKKMRDAESIIVDMLKKTDGDVFKLSGLGLGERGIRPVLGAAAVYRNAGGGEKGEKAVRAEFDKYRKGSSEEDIDKANKRVLAEQGFETEMQKLRIAMGEQLLPEFIKLIPTLKELLPAFVNMAKIGIPAMADLMKTVADFVAANKDIINSLAAHPVGSLIAYELTKSFAAAGLPSLLRGLLSGAFNGKTPPVPGATPGNGGGPGGALEGGLVTMGAATVYNGYQNYQAGDKRAGDLAAAVRSGAMSPEAAAKEVAAARGRVSEDKSAGNTLARSAINTLAPGVGLYNSFKDSEKTGDHALIGNKELQRAIAEAAAAGVREGVASGMKNNSGSTGAGRSETIRDR